MTGWRGALMFGSAAFFSGALLAAVGIVALVMAGDRGYK
jgi:hypothetical protein